MRAEGVDHLRLAEIERRLLVLLGETDQHLVAGGRPEGGDLGVLDAGSARCLAHFVRIGGLVELDLDLCAALEIDAQANRAVDLGHVVTHGDEASHTEDQ